MPSSHSYSSQQKVTRESPAATGALPSAGWLTALTALLRLLAGAVFVVSGFAKSVDPWGFIYKLQDYMAVWDLSAPHAVVVNFAILLSACELTGGMMLLLGCYRRTVVWALLALMAVMLPLTVYIWLYDPVADCGCFGEMIRLGNGATLLKNVLLTGALIFLAFTNRSVRCSVSPYIQWLPATLTIIYSLMISWVGYAAQPYLDFRSFPIGSSLLPPRDAEEGEDAEEEETSAAQPVFEFLYEKEGERRAFLIDELPDSTWTYLDRRLVSFGETARDGLALFGSDGEEVTGEVIEAHGPMMIVTIPSLHRADLSYTYYLNRLYTLLRDHGVPLIAVIAGSDHDVEIWRDLSMAEYPIYNADAPQIKELARGNMGMVTLQDGIVTGKMSAGEFFDEYYTPGEPADLGFLAVDNDEDAEEFAAITATYGIAMALIIAVNNGFLALLSLWRARLRKRRAAASTTAAQAKEGDVGDLGKKQ